jgi:flap endonuclease-1
MRSLPSSIHINLIRFAEARALFKSPEITPVADIKLEWKAPDEAKLIEFLVGEKGFQLERVKAGIVRIHAARGKSSQKRLESFFTAAPATSAGEKPNAKRKPESSKGKPSKGMGLAKKDGKGKEKETKKPAAKKKKTGLF